MSASLISFVPKPSMRPLPPRTEAIIKSSFTPGTRSISDGPAPIPPPGWHELQYLAKTACPAAGSPAEGVEEPELVVPPPDEGEALLSQATRAAALSTSDKI